MSDAKAKCTKFDFGWGSATDRAVGAYNAPGPSSWIYGAASRPEGARGKATGIPFVLLVTGWLSPAVLLALPSRPLEVSIQ